jgi:hypothetical protein
MAQTNVQRRKSGYYYRQKIPADLPIQYGKREIVRSLQTSKKRKASAAGYEQGYAWTRDFARIRAGGLQTVPRATAEAQGQTVHNLRAVFLSDDNKSWGRTFRATRDCASAFWRL